MQWLQRAKPKSMELVPTGDYVLVSMSAAAAERLFGVELVQYQRIGRGLTHTIIRAKEQVYRLPSHVARFIYRVSGLTDFPPMTGANWYVTESSSSMRVRSTIFFGQATESGR